MNTVKRGVLEVEYTIHEYEKDDGGMTYDWWAGDGFESDELFDTAEDAEYGVRAYFGAR